MVNKHKNKKFNEDFNSKLTILLGMLFVNGGIIVYLLTALLLIYMWQLLIYVDIVKKMWVNRFIKDIYRIISVPIGKIINNIIFYFLIHSLLHFLLFLLILSSIL